MKYTKLLILILLIASILPTFSSCTSKEERCEQVAFALYRNGFIKNRMYQSKSVQRTCIAQWDTVCIPAKHGDCGDIKDNGDWRDCILDAKSKAEMNKCGKPYIKPDKFD